MRSGLAGLKSVLTSNNNNSPIIGTTPTVISITIDSTGKSVLVVFNVSVTPTNSIISINNIRHTSLLTGPANTNQTYTFSTPFTTGTICTATSVSGLSPAVTNGFPFTCTNDSVIPPVPVNTVVPVITGTPEQGIVLTCSTGTWLNSPTSYAYQWNSNGTNVGTNQNTYTPVSSDVGNNIGCSVTGSNANPATTTANAVPVGPVIAPPPVNTVLPAITGTAQQGQTLTCSTGTWLNNPTGYAYQWQSNGTNVGISQNTYVPVGTDVGNTITCTVAAQNAAGSTGATSPATGTITGPIGQNPTAYWKLNEASNSASYVDQCSSPCNFSRSGTVTRVTGKLTNAASPATGAYVDNTSPPGKMAPGTGKWFVAAWVNLTSETSQGNIFSWGPVGSQPGFALYINSSGWNIITYQSSQASTLLTTTDGISTSTWHYVAAWFDGSHIYLQIDGGTIHSKSSAAGQSSTGFYALGSPSIVGSECELGYWVGYNPTTADMTYLAAAHTYNGTYWS